jgi:hypothetical protein
MTKSEQLQAILNKSGINTRRVKVLGIFAHVDTYKTHERALADIMSTAGFKTSMASDGVHLDGVNGFRMVFQVAL